MTTFLYFSENLNENVTLRCEPQLPDKQLISVKWFLDGALLKQLPDCRNRYSTCTLIQPANILCIKRAGLNITTSSFLNCLWIVMGRFFEFFFCCRVKIWHTVVGDNINIMKTTFECNFDLYQAFKQHGYAKIWKQREKLSILRSFSFITCKLVIRKKLVNN